MTLSELWSLWKKLCIRWLGNVHFSHSFRCEKHHLRHPGTPAITAHSERLRTRATSTQWPRRTAVVVGFYSWIAAGWMRCALQGLTRHHSDPIIWKIQVLANRNHPDNHNYSNYPNCTGYLSPLSFRYAFTGPHAGLQRKDQQITEFSNIKNYR